jgi:hypothetical protein
VFKLRTEQVISDFDGDGYSDILWQNTSGEVVIWEMNGTSVIGGGLGNRGRPGMRSLPAISTPTAT